VSPRRTLSEPADLAGFPAVRPPDRLHRVCRRTNGTWWFSCDGSGRFDLDTPEGTCLFATDLYAAVREASRLGPVTPQWIAGAASPPDGERRRLDVADAQSAGVQVIEPPDSAVLTVLP
jgi:hypothetical protein